MSHSFRRKHLIPVDHRNALLQVSPKALHDALSSLTIEQQNSSSRIAMQRRLEKIKQAPLSPGEVRGGLVNLGKSVTMLLVPDRQRDMEKNNKPVIIRTPTGARYLGRIEKIKLPPSFGTMGYSYWPKTNRELSHWPTDERLRRAKTTGINASNLRKKISSTTPKKSTADDLSGKQQQLRREILKSKGRGRSSVNKEVSFQIPDMDERGVIEPSTSGGRRIMWDASSQTPRKPRILTSVKNEPINIRDPVVLQDQATETSILCVKDQEQNTDNRISINSNDQHEYINHEENAAVGHDLEEETSSVWSIPSSFLTNDDYVVNEDWIRKRHGVLFCVFMYLNVRQLSRASLVCREWYYVSRHPDLWRRVVLEKGAMSSQYLKRMSKWATKLQSLTLHRIHGRRIRQYEPLDNYNKAIRGSLEMGLEYVLESAKETLLSLRIINCGNILTERSVWLAGSYTRSLQRLAYISQQEPVGQEVIWSLGAGCRDLTTLIIPPMFPSALPDHFNNTCVQMIARCWPNIRVLCIGGVEVDMDGLMAVVKGCPRLQVLELDHMLEITTKMAREMCSHGLQGLKALDFTFTPVTPKAVLHFVSACTHLSSISIHVGISDYYQDTENLDNKRQFYEIVNKMRILQRRPAFSKILHIKSDYG